MYMYVNTNKGMVCKKQEKISVNLKLICRTQQEERPISSHRYIYKN